jgi:hypothetical protein
MDLFWHNFRHFTVFLLVATTGRATTKCRSQPGDASFPTTQDFSLFNSSLDGRLIHVIPSALFCKDLPGGCTDAVYENSIFTGDVPGAMLQVRSVFPEDGANPLNDAVLD